MRIWAGEAGGRAGPQRGREVGEQEEEEEEEEFFVCAVSEVERLQAAMASLCCLAISLGAVLSPGRNYSLH
ncbi:hypothetical protein E2C01_040663 [Portunus trituberculatus]|uniref:Uncharacterized protein n=1 Tax=Portunus trituberculatus TaxID=210409 RepID=A0A5B7FKD9_PORTR|nr:hypothetical protein [Portunus trituberculatus]